jgi:branched-chain amino acid transport system permease protein
MTDRLSIGVERSAVPALPRDILALISILLLGAIGFALFPDDLAFLTRLIGLALLVLSLDLVTGYCGIATLGHAAIFGVSAYAVGNACIAGLTDPTALLLVGAVSGAVAGLVSGALVARFKGLPQLVLSIAIGFPESSLAPCSVSLPSICMAAPDTLSRSSCWRSFSLSCVGWSLRRSVCSVVR